MRRRVIVFVTIAVTALVLSGVAEAAVRYIPMPHIKE